MTGINLEFNLYRSTYIGSGYSDYSLDYRYMHKHEFDLPKLKDILLNITYCKFKIVITVTQTDFTQLKLYEHEVTLDYIAQLSMCKKAFELLGITVIE
jgi:hypothetical protein